MLFVFFVASTYDHRVKEVRRINGYVRYMYDFVLFAATKAVLKEELFLNMRPCV